MEIDVLDQRRRARRQVLVIAAGVATAATLMGLLFLVVSPNTLHALWTGHVRTLLLQRWLDGLVGLIVLVVGIVQWRRARGPRPARKPKSDRLDRPRVLFGLVLANTLVSATNPATMYLVVRTIGTTHPIWWPVEYAVFLLGLSAPYLLLALALTRIPALARRIARMMAWVGRQDLRRPIAALLVALGSVLLIWSGSELSASY